MKDNMKLEMEAGRNIQLDHIKEIMKQSIPDLLAENQKLKEQLDREIHINRIMKNALKDISEQFDKIDFGDFEKDLICKTSRLTLKEIDNKE